MNSPLIVWAKPMQDTRLNPVSIAKCDKYIADCIIPWERKIREATGAYTENQDIEVFRPAYDAIFGSIPLSFTHEEREYIIKRPDQMIEEVSCEIDLSLNRRPLYPNAAKKPVVIPPAAPTKPASTLSMPQGIAGIDPNAIASPVQMQLPTVVAKTPLEQQVLDAIKAVGLPLPTGISVIDLPVLLRLDLELGFGESEDAQYQKKAEQLRRALAKATRIVDASSDREPKVTFNEDGDLSLIFVKRQSKWNFPMLSAVINDDFVQKYRGKGLTMFLGIDEEGEPLVVNRRDYSCLVRWSGITNSGKGESGLLDIFWIHSTQTLRTCEIYIHDPKRVDFEPLAGLNLVKTVGTSSADFVELIVTTHKELRRRQDLFLKARAKKIEEYNEKNPANALPYILLKTDEVVSTIRDLQSNPEIIGKICPDFVEIKTRGTGDNLVEEPSYTKCWQRFENLLFDIASQARFAGIHWDAIAQQQKADALDTRIRDQASVAISFQVATSSDSLLAIGQTSGWGGAHCLTGKGDGLVRLDGRVIRVYMPRVDDHLKDDLLKFSETQMAPKPTPVSSATLVSPAIAQANPMLTAVNVAQFGLSGGATVLLSDVIVKKNLTVPQLQEAAREQQLTTQNHQMIATSMFQSGSADAIELVKWLLGEEKA